MNLAEFRSIADLRALARTYESRGFQLLVTGGAVRDFALGRTPDDIDLISDAEPADSAELVRAWAGNVIAVPNPFGVIQCEIRDMTVQVITFRTLDYDYSSASISDARAASVRDHLACFDLTVNTTSVRLTDLEVIDPFDGAADLRAGLLRTPVDPSATIAHWPLNMVRTARFAAELGFDVSPDLVVAMKANAPKIVGESREELDKSLTRLLAGPHASRGLELLVATGLMAQLPADWRDRLRSTTTSADGERLLGSGTQTDLVARVLAIATHAFGRSVRSSDNFFDLGGDSLMAIQMTAGIEELLGREVEADKVLTADTFGSLARDLAAGANLR